jgi:methyltransferase (TIGR00027 family)
MPGSRYADVDTPHAYTALMCAGSRYEETIRKDSLFRDPLAKKLAGQAGLQNPMGAWVMVPRTRFGDDFLRWHYGKATPCRQLVLLGAGLDTRAFRMEGISELNVFEVDQPTLFEYKEPLLKDAALAVQSRVVVPYDFSSGQESSVDNAGDHDLTGWARALLRHGFDPSIPTVWLLEGLVMYLTIPETKQLMHAVGRLSACGSAVFHDAITATYVQGRIVVGGAPFVGGSDDYAGLWRQEAGFQQTDVMDFNKRIKVDRANRRLQVFKGHSLSERECRGQNIVLWVQSEKFDNSTNRQACKNQEM